MPERLVALGDCGATDSRVLIFNLDGHAYDMTSTPTVAEDYEGSVQRLADAIETETADRGELVAASIAIAATPDEEGVLIQSGGLTPWLGNNFGADVAAALDLPRERVGTPNDVAAIGIGQQHINAENGRPVNGVAATLSSGFNTAFYPIEGKVRGSEEGHEDLREGATCTCGEDGHVEAYISGGGVEINRGVPMVEWLKDPQAGVQLAEDITETFVNLLRRQRETHSFVPAEVRWTGSVALEQPFVMRQAAKLLREHLGPDAPAFDTATMGPQAGLHGTFVDATRRLLAA